MAAILRRFTQRAGFRSQPRQTNWSQTKCLQQNIRKILVYDDWSSSHLIFYSLKTVVKCNCVQSSYKYTMQI